MNFKYYMPTKVFAGFECIKNNGEIVKTLGNKAMLVTGANSAKANGSEKDVTDLLEKLGIDYLIFDKVMSNPTIECAYEGAEVAKKNGVDFIIAIGGGSPMDAGKAIALLAAQDIDESKLFSGSYENKVLPMVFIPTTAGTGSEVTQYSILTNDKAQTKTSIASDLIFPEIAFLDAKYTEKLSLKTTINTMVDALSHAVEGMLSARASVVSNALAIQSINLIMDCASMIKALKAADKKFVEDFEIREKLLNASFMAGMVIAQTGTTAVHAMGYSLTYFKDIDHGRANGLLLAEYLKLVEKQNVNLALSVLAALGLKSTEKFNEFLDSLLGDKESINLEEIEKYSGLAMATKNIANSAVKPTQDDLKLIYKASLNI